MLKKDVYLVDNSEIYMFNYDDERPIEEFNLRLDFWLNEHNLIGKKVKLIERWKYINEKWVLEMRVIDEVKEDD